MCLQAPGVQSAPSAFWESSSSYPLPRLTEECAQGSQLAWHPEQAGSGQH